MKWLLIVPASLIVLLLVLWFGVKIYFALWGNERVAQELLERPEGERAAIVMLLTLPSGEVFPVNYLQEGEQIFVGADGGWWKLFRDGNVPVTVFVKGRELSGRARTVLDDPAYTRQVFARLRPRAPAWLPEWLNARLIVIDLMGLPTDQ